MLEVPAEVLTTGGLLGSAQSVRAESCGDTVAQQPGADRLVDHRWNTSDMSQVEPDPGGCKQSGDELAYQRPQLGPDLAIPSAQGATKQPLPRHRVRGLAGLHRTPDQHRARTRVNPSG